MNAETKDSTELAKDAINYVLERIKQSPDIRYHMGALTEAFERLKKAHSALNGISEEAIEQEIFGYRLKHKAAAQVLEKVKDRIDEMRRSCGSSVDEWLVKILEVIHEH